MEQGTAEVLTSTTPAVVDIILVALLIGVIVYGLTEAIKIPYHRYCKKRGKEHATWWKVMIRVIPMFLGVGIGYFFFTFPWGVAVGGGAGVLSSVLYKRAKKFILDFKGEELVDK